MAKNQVININLRSVNRRNIVSKWLSYYGIIQSTSTKYVSHRVSCSAREIVKRDSRLTMIYRLYDAHETSHIEDVAIALLCGDINFRSYAGVAIVDGHRLKLCYQEWKSLLVMKILRKRLMQLASRAFQELGAWRNEDSDRMAIEWLNIVQELLSVCGKRISR